MLPDAAAAAAAAATDVAPGRFHEVENKNLWL
jgi:hypothetical protein